MTRTFVSIITIVLVLTACGGSSTGGSTTTSTTTSTTSTTTSTSIAPTTSSTSVPTTTTTMAPPPDSLFVVTGVASGDVLNVREQPDASAAIVGTLEPGAVVHTTGLATSDVPAAGWWQVTLDDGTQGWANRRFIGLGPSLTTPLSSVGCGETASGVTPSTGPSTDADHILAIVHEQGADCDRVVILLGAGAGGSTDWPESVAVEAPSGIVVTAEDTRAVVSFPSETDGGSVANVRPTATEATFTDAEAFVARAYPPDGQAALGGPQVIVNFHRNITVEATVLSNPARVIVDVYPAPTGTGLDYTPKIDGGTVLEHPVQVDLGGTGVTLPVTVTGYQRPFEAQGAAVLRTVGSAPGSGNLVEAEFFGRDGTRVTDSTYPYHTTDWTMMWGRFEFTIDGLSPGMYELFVGEFSAKDGTPIGVYDVFTVAG